MNDITHCTLCPRLCGADRTRKVGICGADKEIRICRAALHMWEEPCISGERGSGTVFFAGCPLHCVFCQNGQISRGGVGRAVSEGELACEMLALAGQGAHNINLVSPTQYAHVLPAVLGEVREKAGVPVVCNTGGYERVETLRALDGCVDVYLPDLKYHDSELSRRYSAAPDYFEVAMSAIEEMVAQRGEPRFVDGMLVSGVMVRHLVLPGCRRDSIAVINALGERFAGGQILVSLMSQYTPMPGVPKELSRAVTTFEYKSVCDAVREAGFDGYFQEKTAAGKGYIPPFEV